MTKRMARMDAMMISPPTTTRRAASRSARTRRSVRAFVMTSELTATLLDLVQLFLRDGRGDREVPVLDDDLLPFLRHHQPDELTAERVERLARGLVDVDV